MTKVTYIISDVQKSLAFEWIGSFIDKKKIALSFILLNNEPSYLEEWLNQQRFEVYRVSCDGKKSWPQAFLQTYRLLRKIKPLVVHCHLLNANIIGLPAARMAGISKRIYTRHHSSLHHVYFKKGVLWDKIANFLATHVVAISGTVRNILIDWEKVNSKKINLIHHGFLLDEFSTVDTIRKNEFRQRHGIPADRFVVGVISRFTEWKGIQYIIPAFQKLLEEQPNALLLLLNAKGDYEQEIKGLLGGIPSSAYKMVTFEKDVAAAYAIMDVFVHTPIDEHSEAFGQVYIESLAAGVPSVFTLSGIAADFIIDRCNALVVPFKDSQSILLALTEIKENRTLVEVLKSNGKKSVEEQFHLNKMIDALENLYES